MSFVYTVAILSSCHYVAVALCLTKALGERAGYAQL